MNDTYPGLGGDNFGSDLPFPSSPPAFIAIPIVFGVVIFLIFLCFCCRGVALPLALASQSNEPQSPGDAATAAEAAVIADAIMYPPPVYPPPSSSPAEPAPPVPAATSKPPPFDVRTLVSFEASPAQRATVCSICLEPFGTEPLTAGACAHVFHAACVARWLARDAHSSCPVCRLPFASGEVEAGAPHGTFPRLQSFAPQVALVPASNGG